MEKLNILNNPVDSINIIGEKFNKLKIIEIIGRNKYNRLIVKCVCECNKQKEVLYNHLKSGNTKSCGCLRFESRVFTESHKNKISKSNIGKKMNKKSRYHNMYKSLRYNVNFEWLIKFDNIDKIILLNRTISKTRDRIGDDDYIRFIEKFYYDEKFNKIYDSWIISGKNKYLKPSLDHITPVSKGGTNDISNLQILTWFENRCKNDMLMDEWNGLKFKINEYFL